MEDIKEDTQLKHIIWIEDFDDNDTRFRIEDTSIFDSDDDELPMESEYFEDVKRVFGKYASNVKLCFAATEALEYIDENYFMFDCVVLDINLKQTSTDKLKLKEILMNKGVYVPSEVEENDIKKNCGYYIYLYLLKSGFPASNIIMFTGNKGAENTTGVWEENFKKAGLCPPATIGKNVEEDLIKQIDTIYKNEYYQTRLMVIKACEYWKEKLTKFQNNGEVFFNSVYYENEEDMRIDLSLFIDMIDRVEMLFPITVPLKKQKIYFQAMQVVCMFHEKSANIGKIKKKSESGWFYHQAIRSFRNWSAHNKFSKDSIDNFDDIVFSYLFLVALRTYFHDDGITEKFYYETAYCENNIERIEKFQEIPSHFEKFFEKFQDEYVKSFYKHFNKVKNNQSLEKNKKIWECKDVHSILLESGNCKENDMSIEDLFFNIMKLHLNISLEFSSDSNDADVTENDTGVTVKIKVTWNENVQIFDEKDSFFRKMAYVLFTKPFCSCELE